MMTGRKEKSCIEFNQTYNSSRVLTPSESLDRNKGPPRSKNLKHHCTTASRDLGHTSALKTHAC